MRAWCAWWRVADAWLQHGVALTMASACARSNWGTVQTMGCGAFEDEVGPSDLCTGGAVATAPWASLVLVVAAVVAVIELQTAGMVASHVA